MIPKLKLLLGTIVSVYLLVGTYLYVFQQDFIYFPTAETAHVYQTESFAINGEILNVIVLNPGQSKAIMYFGGNAESVANTASNYVDVFPDHTVYFVDYPGFGSSSGIPTEQAIYRAAEYLFDQVSETHQHVSVIGRSLGTGVATFLASTKSVYKMVLITPYDSIENVAQGRYPMYPMSLLLHDKYDSISRVTDIESDTLIILAEHDAIIPSKNSALLIDAFPPAQLTVETIKGANHNNLSHSDRYYSLLKSFNAS